MQALSGRLIKEALVSILCLKVLWCMRFGARDVGSQLGYPWDGPTMVPGAPGVRLLAPIAARLRWSGNGWKM